MMLQMPSALRPLDGGVIAPRLERVIAPRLERLSGGARPLNMGRLHPALIRLAQRALLRGGWSPTDRHRKPRLAALAPVRLRELAGIKREWQPMSGIIHTLPGSEA